MNLTPLKIKNIREGLRWSQQQLSDMLWVNRVTLATYENGKAKIPYEKLTQLEEIFERATGKEKLPYRVMAQKTFTYDEIIYASNEEEAWEVMLQRVKTRSPGVVNTIPLSFTIMKS